MNLISLFLFAFALVWTVGGLAAFAWLYDRRILRFLKRSWKNLKEFTPKAALFLAMLGPFYIPIIVSALCLFFG